MRAITVFFALLATVAGAYGGFWVMRELGPADLTGQYGRGNAASIEGNFMQSANFERVIEALERELGPDGRLQSLNVNLLEVDATAIDSGRRLVVRIDASGRSMKDDVGEADPIGTVPVAKLDPKALDRISKAARKETGEPVERLSLTGSSRQWNVYMLRGEPDSFIANLNGKGLRLSGEENPEPGGAEPDSLMRAENLHKVLDAAAKEGDALYDLTVWPERASVAMKSGGRVVALQFGFDGELTGRDISAPNGAQTKTIRLSRVDPRAIERMAKSRYAKGLKNAMYAILRPDIGFSAGEPQWLLYLPEGSDPPYLTANIKGRGISWPGRG
ncbi:hypothetical protein DVA67_031270 [Solirubrobacter sp. CPCC 204708]|uniref:Uncharacterized protein n=1 Tax=Solirubrobacter deserti TaxID=2282478 RepID=A0ABT4RQC9_9ACTN|nr:hypothetical protein [Solirubrobacter deserti]MBE2320485.1 hypothetical protein [Solirubrobacter deserti]MDA0140731.1 hypothetical protein [Solirubrobacter deserti]